MLLCFCYAEVRPLLPLLEYYVNYETISEVFCINKDEPMTTCEGKCYLRLQLGEAQESKKKENSVPTVVMERMPMICFACEFPKLTTQDITFQKFPVLYQFSIKDLSIKPPTPPPQG